MRVRCVAESLTVEQAEQMALKKWYATRRLGAVAGEEYTVLGLYVVSGVPWVQIEARPDQVFAVPLCLFEVFDGRLSQYWVLKASDTTLIFWPPSFYQEFYFDDLIQRVPDVLADFQRVKQAMYEEFDS